MGLLEIVRARSTTGLTTLEIRDARAGADRDDVPVEVRQGPLGRDRAPVRRRVIGAGGDQVLVDARVGAAPRPHAPVARKWRRQASANARPTSRQESSRLWGSTR